MFCNCNKIHKIIFYSTITGSFFEIFTGCKRRMASREDFVENSSFPFFIKNYNHLRYNFFNEKKNVIKSNFISY